MARSLINAEAVLTIEGFSVDTPHGYADSGDVEIVVSFGFKPGCPASSYEPGYGPEIQRVNAISIHGCDVPLPMAAQQAMERFVEWHMDNDKHGIFEDAMCDAMY